MKNLRYGLTYEDLKKTLRWTYAKLAINVVSAVLDLQFWIRKLPVTPADFLRNFAPQITGYNIRTYAFYPRPKSGGHLTTGPRSSTCMCMCAHGHVFVCGRRCTVIFSPASTCLLVWQHDALFCWWNSWEFPARWATVDTVSEWKRGADCNGCLVRREMYCYSQDLLTYWHRWMRLLIKLLLQSRTTPVVPSKLIHR